MLRAGDYASDFGLISNRVLKGADACFIHSYTDFGLKYICRIDKPIKACNIIKDFVVDRNTTSGRTGVHRNICCVKG